MPPSYIARRFKEAPRPAGGEEAGDVGPLRGSRPRLCDGDRHAAGSLQRRLPRVQAASQARRPLPIRFHDLRHTCATLMLSEGVNPKIVQELLGHSKISQTMNTYSHVMPDIQERVAVAVLRRPSLGPRERPGKRTVPPARSAGRPPSEEGFGVRGSRTKDRAALRTISRGSAPLILGPLRLFPRVAQQGRI